MPGIDETRAYLRISSDHLEPDAITTALRAPPAYAFRKGDLYRQRIAKTGRWVIDAAPSKPSDLDHQVAELLARMTDDLAIWNSITIVMKRCSIVAPSWRGPTKAPRSRQRL